MGELLHLPSPSRSYPVRLAVDALSDEEMRAVWDQLVGLDSAHELRLAMAIDPRVPEGTDTRMVRDWLLSNRLCAVGAMPVRMFEVVVEIITRRLTEADDMLDGGA